MSLPFDQFDDALDAVTSPARDAFAVVPHDTAPLPRLPKALLVGGGDRWCCARWTPPRM